MIQANELRIGNWLERLDGTFFQVSYSTYQDFYIYPEYLLPKPTPLTEEWLMKFGFEKIKKDSYSTGKKVDFNVFILGLFSFNSIQKNWWYCNSILENPPKYVHQLQNLNFALTGEELTIKN